MGFITEVLGGRMDDHPKLIEFCESVRDYPVTACAAAHGVGKSWTTSRLALWWNQTRVDSLVVTTAPGWSQVEDIIWREIADAWDKAKIPLRGELLKVALNLAPKWFMVGLSPNDPNRFQGLHAPGGVFLIVDEANAVPEKIFERASTLDTQGESKRVYIGNPYVRSGTMYRCFPESGEIHLPGRVNAMSISAFDAPARVLRPEKIEEKRHELGPDPETNPLYQVQVLGQWPTSDEFGLFPISLLAESDKFEPSVLHGRRMGVDVARFGSDKCVALLLIDGRVSAVHEWGKVDLMASRNIVLDLADAWEVEGQFTNVDSVGLGAGLLDTLREHDFNCQGVNNGIKGGRGDYTWLVGKDMKFLNRRAELYWVARRLLDEHQLSVPEKYRMLWTDLVAIPYRYNTKGELVIPPKDEIRKMLGRSPDYADALTLALAQPKRRTAHVGGTGPRGRRMKV